MPFRRSKLWQWLNNKRISRYNPTLREGRTPTSLLARNRPPAGSAIRPPSGAKGTWHGPPISVAIDPERMSILAFRAPHYALMPLDRNHREHSLTGERVQRRLAAILAADVVGYSRLVSADEADALARLRSRPLKQVRTELL